MEEIIMYTNYICYTKTHTDMQKDLCIRLVLGTKRGRRRERKWENNKFWCGYIELLILIHCYWECKMV